MSAIILTALFGTHDFFAILARRDGLSNRSDNVAVNQRGVNFDCSMAKPPPRRAKFSALAAWSGLIFSGTNIAARPIVSNSMTVLAPLRPITRSASTIWAAIS